MTRAIAPIAVILAVLATPVPILAAYRIRWDGPAMLMVLWGLGLVGIVGSVMFVVWLTERNSPKD